MLQAVAQLEEEKRHLEFMRSVCKYDQDQEDGQGGDGRSEKTDLVVDLFPDDQDDERNSKCTWRKPVCKFHANKTIKLENANPRRKTERVSGEV